LGGDLEARLGLEVVLTQEAHALCLAERTYGAARGVADFAMMDITGGLGLGVVHRGQLIEGHSGLAGELGHVRVELDGRRCGGGRWGRRWPTARWCGPAATSGWGPSPASSGGSSAGARRRSEQVSARRSLAAKRLVLAPPRRPPYPATSPPSPAARCPHASH